MHPKHSLFPTQGELLLPILDTVRDMGGIARASDVTAALAERLSLADRIAANDDADLPEMWRRHVAFARLKAVRMGYLKSAGRGRWQMPDDAAEGVAQACTGVIFTVHNGPDGLPAFASVRIGVSLPRLDTLHTLVRGNACDLSFIGDNQVQLIASSVPYWNLKDYGHDEGQLALTSSLEQFMAQMETALAEMYRVLAPGCRAAINVGDLLLSRKAHGRHRVLPLHAHLLTAGERVGFDCLNSIIWQKIGTFNAEQGKSGGLLGKPGQPGQIVPLDHDHLLLFRKPGAYRSTTPALMRDSELPIEESRRNFHYIWNDIPGERTKPGGHPAPYPVALPQRIIRSFSFSGDTVLDPFSGSFTTTIAAMREGRHSLGIEISTEYLANGIERVRAAADTMHALAA